MWILFYHMFIIREGAWNKVPVILSHLFSTYPQKQHAFLYFFIIYFIVSFFSCWLLATNFETCFSSVSTTIERYTQFHRFHFTKVEDIYWNRSNKIFFQLFLWLRNKYFKGWRLVLYFVDTKNVFKGFTTSLLLRSYEEKLQELQRIFNFRRKKSVSCVLHTFKMIQDFLWQKFKWPQLLRSTKTINVIDLKNL